jgi:hypothetical protein
VKHPVVAGDPDEGVPEGGRRLADVDVATDLIALPGLDADLVLVVGSYEGIVLGFPATSAVR